MTLRQEIVGTAMQVGRSALAGESPAFQYFTSTGGVDAFEEGIQYGVRRGDKQGPTGGLCSTGVG